MSEHDTHAASSTPAATVLETRGRNEEMRHVLRLDFLLRKFESDFAHQARILAATVSSLSEETRQQERVRAAEKFLLGAVRWMESIASVARHKVVTSPPDGMALVAAVEHAITNALDALRHLEPATFRRREPFHHFSRSSAETLFTCFAATASRLDEATYELGKVVPDLYERLDPKLTLDPRTSAAPRLPAGNSYLGAY